MRETVLGNKCVFGFYLTTAVTNIFALINISQVTYNILTKMHIYLFVKYLFFLLQTLNNTVTPRQVLWKLRNSKFLAAACQLSHANRQTDGTTEERSEYIRDSVMMWTCLEFANSESWCRNCFAWKTTFLNFFATLFLAEKCSFLCIYVNTRAFFMNLHIVSSNRQIAFWLIIYDVDSVVL